MANSPGEIGTEETTLAELFEIYGEQFARNLMVSMPVKVEAYHVSTQTVDVTPQLNRALPDMQGNYIAEALPKINDVPVCFPRGGGAFVSMPLQAGDFGLIVICDRNISQWRSTGAQGDPGDLGLHTLDGAVFLPVGPFPDSKPLQNADANNVVIGFDATPAARIVIKSSGEIDVGASATNFVAMADKVLTQLNAISSAFSTHTHSIPALTVTGGSTSPGTTGPAPSYSASSVASSNLKAND